MSPGLVLLIALLNSGTLIEAPGVELVRGHCSGCHSERLITQNRGTRDDWLRTIRWMQRTQNLWPLEPTVEKTILDYLATNYPPGRASRRPPLHPSLMPPGPGMTKTQSAKPPEPQAVTKAAGSDSVKPGGCGCDVGRGDGSFAPWAALVLLGFLRRWRPSP